MATFTVKAQYDFGDRVKYKSSKTEDLIIGVVIGYELRPGNTLLYIVKYFDGYYPQDVAHHDFELEPV